MKTKLLGLVCRVTLLLMTFAPTLALAQRRGEPDREPIDARLEGYPTNVTIEGGGTALLWLMLGVMGALVFAGLFKDAKRSHLD